MTTSPPNDAPPQDASDDESGDIRDNRLLGRLVGELKQVSRRNDNALMIALAFLVGVIVVYDRSGLRRPWLDALAMVTVAAALVATIVRNVSQKRDVATRYGLRCPKCGYVPLPNMVLSAATTRRCAKCRTALPAKVPRQGSTEPRH